MAVADGFHLPYRGASCDAVLCIAVLHHMSSPARRLRLLQELLRILRPGTPSAVLVTTMLLYLWSTRRRRHSPALAIVHSDAGPKVCCALRTCNERLSSELPCVIGWARSRGEALD